MLGTKKAKRFVEAVSIKTNQPVDVVNAVVDYYYTACMKTMSSLEHPTLIVPYLGTFKVSRQKITHAIGQLEEYLDKFEAKDFESIGEKQKLEGFLELYKTILKKIIDRENERTERKKALEAQK